MVSVGRKRHKMRRGKGPPFVAVPYEILNNSAFKLLPMSAKSALPYFLGKPKIFFTEAEYLTTKFSFSYREASKYGYARGTFHRIIVALVSYGFIDPVDKGGLRGFGKSTSLFKLSKRWREFGTPNFQRIEWSEFKPRA